METQLSPEVKRKRSSVLRELGRQKKQAFMETQIGKTLDILFEEKGNDGFFIGTAGNYLKVKALADTPVLRDIVDIRIVGHDGETLIGAAIKTP
jgi:threonylcarbamoyladenosine tRNA methylthiotransferase MtaB